MLGGGEDKPLFLDVLASQEIPKYPIYGSLTHSLTQIQSSKNFLGQVFRPFRQSKQVKKGNIAIIAIIAIMAITVNMAIAVITAITDIRVIRANTGIGANCSQCNYYCQ